MTIAVKATVYLSWCQEQAVAITDWMLGIWGIDFAWWALHTKTTLSSSLYANAPHHASMGIFTIFSWSYAFHLPWNSCSIQFLRKKLAYSQVVNKSCAFQRTRTNKQRWYSVHCLWIGCGNIITLPIFCSSDDLLLYYSF